MWTLVGILSTKMVEIGSLSIEFLSHLFETRWSEQVIKIMSWFQAATSLQKDFTFQTATLEYIGWSGVTVIYGHDTISML